MRHECRSLGGGLLGITGIVQLHLAEACREIHGSTRIATIDAVVVRVVRGVGGVDGSLTIGDRVVRDVRE